MFLYPTLHSMPYDSLAIWCKTNLHHIPSKKSNYFTLKKPSTYEFGYYNGHYKPSPVTEQKFTSNDNSLKQHSKLKLLDEHEIEQTVFS